VRITDNLPEESGHCYAFAKLADRRLGVFPGGKGEGKLGVARAGAVGSGKPPPKRALTSVTGNEPSGSRKH